MKILSEDKYICVCVKEPGMLSEEDGNKRSVPKFLKERYAELGERTDIYTVHRLDKNVGGVMVCARNPKSASILASAIGSREVEKIYHAVVLGVPEQEKGTFTDLLLHDASKNKTYVVDRMRKGVREAALEYELVKAVRLEGRELSLVRVKLLTGRTHQIRVQFASRKMPLAGDGRYGSGDGRDSPALFASSLSFTHPKTGKRMTFEQELPEEEPFGSFKE